MGGPASSVFPSSTSNGRAKLSLSLDHISNFTTAVDDRWSDVPPKSALTFAALWDPEDGMVTFSGAHLLDAYAEREGQPLIPRDRCSRALSINPASEAPGENNDVFQAFLHRIPRNFKRLPRHRKHSTATLSNRPDAYAANLSPNSNSLLEGQHAGHHGRPSKSRFSSTTPTTSTSGVDRFNGHRSAISASPPLNSPSPKTTEVSTPPSTPRRRLTKRKPSASPSSTSCSSTDEREEWWNKAPELSPTLPSSASPSGSEKVKLRKLGHHISFKNLKNASRNRSGQDPFNDTWVSVEVTPTNTPRLGLRPSIEY